MIIILPEQIKDGITIKLNNNANQIIYFIFKND